MIDTVVVMIRVTDIDKQKQVRECGDGEREAAGLSSLVPKLANVSIAGEPFPPELDTTGGQRGAPVTPLSPRHQKSQGSQELPQRLKVRLISNFVYFRITKRAMEETITLQIHIAKTVPNKAKIRILNSGRGRSGGDNTLSPFGW